MSRILRLDMHVHTSHSHDGRVPPARMVERAAEIGLDGLAITDHNTQAGIAEAEEAGREWGVIVVPGIEVSCLEGHVLVYGCRGLDANPRPTVRELLSWLRERQPSAVAAPAHPFDIYRSGMGWRALEHRFSAVETVNAHSLLPRGAVLPLARRLGVGEVGGSDTHVLRGLGRGRTVVSCDDERLLLGAIGASGRGEGRFDPWSILAARLIS